MSGPTGQVDVTFVGESYEALRGYRIVMDRPADPGADAAPTPVELFMASLATCVAFYTGRRLTRHAYRRDDLTVSAGFTLAADGTPRVSEVRQVVGVSPSLQTQAPSRRSL
jgi:putative redox protein